MTFSSPRAWLLTSIHLPRPNTHTSKQVKPPKQAMCIDYVDIYGVDPKSAAVQFMNSNAKPEHVCHKLSDVLQAYEDLRT